MTDKKQSTPKETTEDTMTDYVLPELGISVRAVSAADAVAKAKRKADA